jgi:phosphoribosylaminoimidazolecarboxamide formyltransferase/IMP cyclohydrolase
VVRALISVSNKQQLGPFAAGLQELGVTIISTGNTARYLQDAGIHVQQVSDVTGFPEIMDGRVKTLHPAVHAGILARRDLPAHMQALEEHGFETIDIVVSNLYPFTETIARPGVTFDEAIENIDIGGPAMVRAAAKNHAHVLIVVDPADYQPLLDALRADQITPEFRRALAAKAFAHTAAYDAAIAGYLTGDPLPQTLPLAFRKVQDLRYGENPHQRAALYGTWPDYFEQLHGKDLSYINILDISAAQELIEEFPRSEGVALAILKHTNPCGVGVGATPLEAWEHAFATDREAPFGGIIVVNSTLDLPLAQAINEIFSEILIAPDFDEDALALLRTKRNRRLMRVRQPVAHAGARQIQSVPGGVLVQDTDRAPLQDEPLQVVTRRAPTDEEWRAMRFGWRVVKHVKSNAIVYSAHDRTLGIGAGQMSRVDSSRVAVMKAQIAGLDLAGSAVASDALFPFPDGVEVAAAAGATAVIQPGGSVRDAEVIAAANRLGMAMVFTGRRHFRH